MGGNYTRFPDLANIYLEDSFVLGIEETPDRLSFRLDAVLTPEHQGYHPPHEGEQHCYANGILMIEAATEIRWLERSNQTYGDATGERDLGNIFYFQRENNYYDISGEWGHVQVYSNAEPRLTIKS